MVAEIRYYLLVYICNYLIICVLSRYVCFNGEYFWNFMMFIKSS